MSRPIIERNKVSTLVVVPLFFRHNKATQIFSVVLVVIIQKLLLKLRKKTSFLLLKNA